MLLAFIITIFTSAIGTILLNLKIGRNGVCFILIGYNIINILIMFILFFCDEKKFSIVQYCKYTESTLLLNFDWGFLIDIISFFFFITILIITTSILLFACSYMYNDPRFSFFLSTLQFSMFFMLILILSNNVIQLFIGWEGVGVISFILINFWYLRINSNKSALKALIFNRIGDFGYIVFLVICLNLFQTTNLNLLSCIQNYTTLKLFSALTLFILLAIFGKSAQLLLYAWLPDAMEGPTPVSALLHSATMVTAGVYLFLRLIEIMYNSSIFWIYFILFISGITSIFCGLYALVKFDVKKIIAFSTCSQLGLMFCTIALGFTYPAFYHLFIHAFFKALSSISSGIIIHALMDEQDIRKYGVNSYFVPYFHLTLLIGSLNIMGVFFLSGFYSKEILLIVSISSFAKVFKSLILISSIFTIAYSIRLACYSLGFNRNYRTIINQINSLDLFILFAINILSLASIFIGYIFTDIFVGIGSITGSLLNVPYSTINFEFITYSIPFLFPILIITFSVLYKTNFKFVCKQTNNLYFTMRSKYIIIKEFNAQSIFWIINSLYNYIVYNYITQIVERGVLDKVSLLGLVNISNNFYIQFVWVFKNNISSLILNILVSLFIMVFINSIITLNFNIFLFYITVIFINLTIPTKKND